MNICNARRPSCASSSRRRCSSSFVLLYLNFGRLTETLIVMLSVPFALVGGAWLMWWLGYNMSVAVAVGFIALAGVAAETGVVMLIYLDQALRSGGARAHRGTASARAR